MRAAWVTEVVFDLAPAPEWQWLAEQPSAVTSSAVTWTRAQATPVRKTGRLITESLHSGRPHHIDAGPGWCPWTSKPTGGQQPSAPPGPAIAITSIGTGTARIALI